MRTWSARITALSVSALGLALGSLPARSAPPAPAIRAPEPAPLAADRVELALPAPAGQIAVGAGGRFLILHLPTARKLAIFDANTARIVRYLSLASDSVRVTAGAEKLFVAAPAERVLQRYSLATFEKELTVALPVETKLHAMLMGSNSRGPLMMAGTVLRFYDPITLREQKYEWSDDALGIGDQYPPVVEVSADGRTFTSRTPGLSSGDLRIFRFQDRSIRRSGAEGQSSNAYLLPNADGSAIFSANRILTPDGKPTQNALDTPRASAWLLPAAQDRYYLSLVKTQNQGANSDDKAHLEASLNILGQERALLPLPALAPSLEGLVNFSSGRVQSLEQHVVFLPASELIAILPVARDRLILHRMSIRDALEKSGLDYLVATSSPPATFSPGKELTYQLQVLSKRGGVKFNLDSGPEGMTMTAGGLLRWSVPAAYPGKEEHVIITLSDATGQEVFHTFRLVRK
jgi:hypothetical protein